MEPRGTIDIDDYNHDRVLLIQSYAWKDDL